MLFVTSTTSTSPVSTPQYPLILEMETGMVWLPAMVRASISVSYLSSLLTRCFKRTATLKLLVWDAGPM